MKLHRFILIFVCFLAVPGIVSCSTIPPTSGTPTPSTTPPDTKVTTGKVTPEQLAAEAEVILVGKVTDIASYQQGEGNIYTLVTLSVEQTIKGEAAGEVVIRIPGGEAGGLTMMVTDNPSFQPEERAVVFLAKGEGIFTVVGGMYGKYTIDENDMVGGRPLTEFIGQLRDTLAKQ